MIELSVIWLNSYQCCTSLSLSLFFSPPSSLSHLATSPDTYHLLSSSLSWEDTSAKAAATKLSKTVATTSTPSRESSTPSRSSQRRPPPLEMSPLIMDMDSDTPTGGDEEDTDVFAGSGRGGVPYVPPETPV